MSNDTLSAHGKIGDNNYFDFIEFTIQGAAIQGGQYIFNPISGKKINFQTLKTCNGYLGSILYQISSSGSGTITKIDKTNKIISGVFNGKIPIPNCDTLNITDGRFDINYY